MRRLQRMAATCLLGVLAVVALTSGFRAYGWVLEADPSQGADATSHYVSLSEVVINEVAWMGTQSSPHDEWLELYNRTDFPVDVGDWSVFGADTGQCLNFSDADGISSTTIPARGYLVYANHRTDVSDSEGASMVAVWDMTIGLNNLSPGQLLLYDALDCAGNTVDVVNQEAGDWFAGQVTDARTMERRRPTSTGVDEANWCTNDPALARNGYDAAGGPIMGTPGARNSCYEPPIPPSANLRVAKHGPAIVRPGSHITYEIEISNTGSTAATDTVLTDTLPSIVVSPSQTSPFSWSLVGHHLVWALGDLLPGTQESISVLARVSVTTSSAAPVVNVVTATTSATETVAVDNSAYHTTTLMPEHAAFLPLVFRDYMSPPYGVIIEALLYDGWQHDDYDEAVLLLNGGDEQVDVTGWELCKLGLYDWTCAGLPSLLIEPRERVWLARSRFYFARSFGLDLPADHALSGWPRLNNSGDELVLRSDDGTIRDVVVYKGGMTHVEGWSGAPVRPFLAAGFAEEGQILYRRLDERTGRAAEDTDTAADWAQYAGDPSHSSRVQYPGWDLDRFYRPEVDASGRFTVGVAPDNAYQLVVDTINSASKTIEIETYTLEHYGLVTALLERAQRGVSVTVLLEGGPVGGVEDQELWACQQLHSTGRGTCWFMVQSDEPKIRARYRHLHAKMVIVDREQLLLGSQNLVHSSLPGDDKANGTGGSRGVVLVTNAPNIVARATEVFEADCDPDHHTDVSVWSPDSWLGYGLPPSGFAPDPGADWVTSTVQFPDVVSAAGTDVELLTAPEAALRRSDALLGLLSAAGPGDEVCVEQLYEHLAWGDDPVQVRNPRIEAYVDAARRGARVRILLNGGTFDLEYLSLLDNVETTGYLNEVAEVEGLDLEARMGDPTEFGIHNKMVLVDLGPRGKVVHVGSVNGSESSSKINREMAIQVESAELYDHLHTVFEYDWHH